MHWHKPVHGVQLTPGVGLVSSASGARKLHVLCAQPHELVLLTLPFPDFGVSGVRAAESATVLKLLRIDHRPLDIDIHVARSVNLDSNAANQLLDLQCGAQPDFV